MASVGCFFGLRPKAEAKLPRERVLVGFGCSFGDRSRRVSDFAAFLPNQDFVPSERAEREDAMVRREERGVQRERERIGRI
jgi:hypothetical protein